MNFYMTANSSTSKFVSIINANYKIGNRDH